MDSSCQPVFFMRFEKEGHRLTGAAFVTAEGSRLFGQTLALLRLVILKQSSNQELGQKYLPSCFNRFAYWFK
jgi:hypothetical protein